MSYNL